jgi:serine/threonine protein kinase
LVSVIALKELHSQDPECFNSEVTMLKTFRNLKHAHLVKLLATFRWKGKYYLMFPYAGSNLREYWQRTPLPDFSQATVTWFLDQIKALASALYSVHEYQLTHPYPPIGQYTSGGNNASGREDDRRYGRHGDIKPENILWFAQEGSHNLENKGHLVIADFGLTDFHKRATRSDVPAGHVTGSPTYEPPELILHWKISRAYDIWSLGCVYLEFVTWLIRGSEVLDRFPEARGKLKDKLDDDTFFTIIGDETPGAPREAVVRESVQLWIAELREQPRSSAFINDILDLISKHMLIINPTNRIKSMHLNLKLREMKEKARGDPSYLTDRVVPHPSSEQLRPMDLAALDLSDGNRSPSATEGTPLPTQPSRSIGLSFMEHSSPQIQPHILANMSPPPSPKLGVQVLGR